MAKAKLSKTPTKALSEEVSKSKAAISTQQLAEFMGVDKDKTKGLPAYCEASQQICNAFADGEMKESHVATMALLHCAVWLHTTGAKTVEKLRELPLVVRYMIVEAMDENNA